MGKLFDSIQLTYVAHAHVGRQRCTCQADTERGREDKMRANTQEHGTTRSSTHVHAVRGGPQPDAGQNRATQNDLR